MPSKIKAFNFRGCQHLRKIVIGNQVELSLKEGVKIDLSDTSITAKNDIQKVNVIDSELEELEKQPTFKDAPEGITSDKEILKKIRLRTGEPQEVQTDPISLHVKGVHLSEWDKRAIERMKGSLFWFDTLKEQGKREYLEQRRDELKVYISNNPARDNLNDTVRRLGEEILMMIEKVLENADYVNDLGHISPNMPIGEARSWKSFHKFLVKELLKEDGLLYLFKDNENIRENIKSDLKTRLNTNTDNLTEFLNLNISKKALDRFMNTMEATLDKDGSKYYTFPDYDDDWLFGDYYEDNTRLIGFKSTPKTETQPRKFNNNPMNTKSEQIFKELFNYWKDTYSGNTPPNNS